MLTLNFGQWCMRATHIKKREIADIDFLVGFFNKGANIEKASSDIFRLHTSFMMRNELVAEAPYLFIPFNVKLGKILFEHVYHRLFIKFD